MKKQLFPLILCGASLLASPAFAAGTLQVCSFNIQFLGSSSTRDNQGLANLLKSEGCDIVAIQELIAPPDAKFLDRSAITKFQAFPENLYDKLSDKEKTQLGRAEALRIWPQILQQTTTGLDGTPAPCNSLPKPIKPEDKVTRFFEAMENAGFKDYIISDENTGPHDIHKNNTSAEWFVTFFNSEKVSPAQDLPHGFLSEVRAGAKPWERTPYAFPFRTKDGNFDFVLISTHLAPGAGAAARRKEELEAASAWVTKNSEIGAETDFIILGDMNIESKEEFDSIVPKDASGAPLFSTLNSTFQPTNTIPKPASKRPYDQFLVNRKFTTEKEIPTASPEDPSQPNFKVVNMLEKMASRWPEVNPGLAYPGDPAQYNHDKFRTQYSDHHPVKVLVTIPDSDDDPSSAPGVSPPAILAAPTPLPALPARELSGIAIQLPAGPRLDVKAMAKARKKAEKQLQKDAKEAEKKSRREAKEAEKKRREEAKNAPEVGQ